MKTLVSLLEGKVINHFLNDTLQIIGEISPTIFILPLSVVL
jgi:hypothetical protein